jgi:hypothetical protein
VKIAQENITTVRLAERRTNVQVSSTRSVGQTHQVTAIASTINERNEMHVYTLLTHESGFNYAFGDQNEPVLYSTREKGELACTEYNETFCDPVPATVVEIEVH